MYSEREIYIQNETLRLVKYFNILIISRIFFTVLCVSVNIIITISIAEVDLVIAHIAFVIFFHVRSVY